MHVELGTTKRKCSMNLFIFLFQFTSVQLTFFFSFLFVQRLLLLHVVGDITPGGHLSPILVDEIYAAMITNPMNNMSTVLAKCIR